MRANLLPSLAPAFVLRACVSPPVSPPPVRAGSATLPAPVSSAVSAPESTPAPTRVAMRMRFPATFPHDVTAYDRVDDDRGAIVPRGEKTSRPRCAMATGTVRSSTPSDACASP